MSHRQVHVSGVGGVGMNAIAQLLALDGVQVSGSDRFLDQGVELPVFRCLRELGVRLLPQDGSGLSTESDALVISTAVEADNPERMRAAALGIPELHRAEMLAQFTRRGDLIAVAGTSGKTSCTGWLGWTLAACGLDPNVVNGGGILGWKDAQHPGNVRWSSSGKLWVVEVDESDGSLLKFDPEIALINTLSADHHSLEDTVELFRTFARKVKRTVICGPKVKAYLEGDNEITAELIEVSDPVEVNLPGAHNAWNAAAVLAVAEVCGLPREQALRALRSFRGVERRLELCSGVGAGPQVYDDYAHNPEKIAAAIRAVQPENGRLTVLWRPHGFAPLQQNFDAFVDCFATSLREQDKALILPVFYAGGTAPRGIDSGDLVDALHARGCKAVLIEDYPSAWEADAEDVLLVMGARDPALPLFAQRMGRVVGPSQ
ncbi:Mur ligase domain-containing protein [Kiritimatiellota bacterium B12222]|nr:Mur ligase domain-containing protein [Kiritimatiellota bacterium B12222]